jgi:magnesium transporter
MAAPRLPVPSPGLLRFLRFQSENLAFFYANPSPAARRALCASRRQWKAPCGGDEVQLQAGLLHLEPLFPSRSVRTPSPRLPKSRRPAPFTAGLGARCSSTDQSCAPSWRDRLWGGPRPRKAPEDLKPDDLPHPPEDGSENNSMFNTRRQRAQQAALEPRLRCTEVDEHGTAILVDGEFKKTELIARVRERGARLCHR